MSKRYELHLSADNEDWIREVRRKRLEEEGVGKKTEESGEDSSVEGDEALGEEE